MVLIRNRFWTKNGKNIFMTRRQNRMKRFLIRRQTLVYPAAEPNEMVPVNKIAVGLSSRRTE